MTDKKEEKPKKRWRKQDTKRYQVACRKAAAATPWESFRDEDEAMDYYREMRGNYYNRWDSRYGY